MSTAAPIDEDLRARRLVEAEEKAAELFRQVGQRGLVASGRLESAVSDDVRDLGADLFGTNRQWHKRVVRSGENTLQPYKENPPDRAIGTDDIVFLDFGPIFSPPGSAEWEADYGRTFVLGDDADKHRLAADLHRVWGAAADHFDAHPDITGAALYERVGELAREAGWEFGGPHAGHLVGEFPHELIDDERTQSYITPGNDTVMRTVDASGRRCHWILEVHLVDRGRGFGGFCEQLLTLRR